MFIGLIKIKYMENEYNSRADEFKKKVTNPCKKFYSWSSNNKCFTYYDKEKGENIQVELPIKFISLKELSTVKGWHDASESGLYSNEVINLFTDELNVRAFKGGDIVKGLYSDIKTKVIASGGHYSKSIYAIDGTGELINISLKGSGVGAWSNFLEKEGRDRLLNEWVMVEEAIPMKKGSISYTIPSFKFLKELSSDDSEEADTKYRAFMDYFSKYNKKEEIKEIDD